MRFLSFCMPLVFAAGTMFAAGPYAKIMTLGDHPAYFTQFRCGFYGADANRHQTCDDTMVFVNNVGSPAISVTVRHRLENGAIVTTRSVAVNPNTVTDVDYGQLVPFPGIKRSAVISVIVETLQPVDSVEIAS